MNRDKAKEILGTIVRDDGSLYCLGQYVYWHAGTDTATLDAEFTADELEAIAWWMRNTKENDND